MTVKAESLDDPIQFQRSPPRIRMTASRFDQDNKLPLSGDNVQLVDDREFSQLLLLPLFKRR